MGNARSQNSATDIPKLLEAAQALLSDGAASFAIIEAHIACERTIAALISNSRKSTATLSPQNSLAKFIRGTINLDIEREPFWRDYCDSLMKRNAIVHQGEKATIGEAKRALKAATAVLRYLERAKTLASKTVVHETDSQVGARFLEALRNRMQALGMTQKELARRLNTSQQRISDTLSGKHSPSLETVGRFANAVDCEVEIRLAPR